MASFSDRMGYTSPRTEIQKDSIDDDLRLDLWNTFHQVCLARLAFHDMIADPLTPVPHWIHVVWARHLREPLDEIPHQVSTVTPLIRKWFFSAEWFRLYNFIEDVAKLHHGEDQSTAQRFVDSCNHALAQNVAAYRFVAGEIVSIVDEVEIQAVEAAVSQQGFLAPVGTHLARALELLSDRETPDYRNSIKEAISAVETLSRVITDDPNATLGKALKKLDAQDEVQLHPALRDALSKLYGYTSDESGIRHALMAESDLDVEDATFMLVACSAFVNYLVQKATKAGIDLS